MRQFSCLELEQKSYATFASYLIPVPNQCCNTMTKFLEKALIEVKKLPDPDQDAIAALILEEIKDETLWDEAIEKSQDVLAKLAAEAIVEDRAGKTEDLDPEKL